MVSDKINDQIEQVFNNVSGVIAEAGGAWENIVKITIYLKDLGHFDLVNTFMNNLFSKPFPARAIVEVNDLPKQALISEWLSDIRGNKVKISAPKRNNKAQILDSESNGSGN